METKQGFLDRFALWIFRSPVMWGFLLFFNLFSATYMLLEENDPHAFDPYPFTFLNLILAIFVAEMDILIVIAQLASSQKTDHIIETISQVVHANDKRDAVIQEMMENSLSVMNALRTMAEGEALRDAELRLIVEAGEKRGIALQELVGQLGRCSFCASTETPTTADENA